jgi:lysozyme
MREIEEQLIKHEGLRQKPYEDTVGKLTIGIGRNLEDKGITKDEAIYLLKNDIIESKMDLINYDWFNKLSDNRKNVLIDMRINLGLGGLLSFKKMIKALKENNFEEAANEMENSKWYHQVGRRSDHLVQMMKENKSLKGVI